ncbi:hypothetical protein AA0472_0223 [Acetobacter estunensis NRIC 0472]|nr:hypothetical protein AA0472_0223 [Acetobacter estunensis NRIC 0472]
MHRPKPFFCSGKQCCIALFAKPKQVPTHGQKNVGRGFFNRFAPPFQSVFSFFLIEEYGGVVVLPPVIAALG